MISFYVWLVLSFLSLVFSCNAEEFIVISSPSSGQKGYRAAPSPTSVAVEDEYEGQQRVRTFSLVSISEEERSSLKNYEGVLDIVPNAPIEPAFDEPTKQWNLDRIDQSFGQDGFYSFTEQQGNGVDIYVVDSGVQGDHVAFTGRVLAGYNAVFPDKAGNADCYGHGTHVAGTAAGEGFGVARKSTVIPVVIFDCQGKGTVMSLTSGIQWVRKSIASRGKKSVVNLSIQTEANTVVDDLVRSLYQIGAVVAVAAANFNSDACNYSPAREPTAVTVGGTSEDDSKLSVSNFGSCVDLYAPGDNILSAAPDSPTATAYKRGTSMASPLVAGILALAYEKFPSFSNDQTIQYVLGIAAKLEKLVNDADCSGSLEGKKIAQTLFSQERPPTRKALLIAGAVDFTSWAPELAFGGCVSFFAQVSASRSLSSAIPQVIVSTDALPQGIVGFGDASVACRNNAARWYALSSKNAYDFQGNVIGFSTLGIGGLTEDKKQFYVSGSQAIEFGLGDGVTNSSPLLTAPITGGLAGFTKLSFSSGQNFDILYSDIQPCQPTPVASKKVVVSSKNKNLFFVWHVFSGCVEFTARFRRDSAFFIGLASQPMGRVRAKASPKSGNILTISVTRQFAETFRNGVWENKRRITLLPKNIMLNYKVVTGKGTQLFINENLALTVEGSGAYFSLASSVARTFTNIKPC